MRNIHKNAVTTFVGYAGYLAFLLRVYRYIERPLTDSNTRRQIVRQELMWQVENNQNAKDILRMGPNAFRILVNILKQKNLLRDTRFSSVEEQLAKFLHILAHNVKIRTVNFFFRRSGETISRHFHQVLRAIILLEDMFLVQSDGLTIPPEILNSEGRFYPYFQNCIGAIDGTHIRVKVPKEDVPRYRGRKGIPTMNILAACTFDLKFTYVLPGWEGSASDSRILETTLAREDNLRVPKGKFFLVDAGYPLRSRFITPFRSTRYHLKEYSRRPPENPKELFNLRHASLRNAIERAFGVLKKRFPIIASGTEAKYDVNTISDIVVACCILHNFLMIHDPDEDLLREVDEDIMQKDYEVDDIGRLAKDADAKLGEKIRNHIATSMWQDYVSRS